MFIGNKRVWEFLKLNFERQKKEHAYLFVGPRSVGKFSAARVLAESLIAGENIFSKPEEVDRLLENMDKPENNPELLVLRPQTITNKSGAIKEREIAVEDVRKALINLSYFPQQGKRRVLIVDGADFLSRGAQNALLKNLEEPNSTTTIVLVAHEDSGLLPTIKSRCGILKFSLVEWNDLAILKLGIKSEELILLAAGRPGILRKMLKDEDFLDERRKMKKNFQVACEGGIGERMTLAQDFAKNVTWAEKNLEFWLYLSRNETEKEGWKKSDVARMEKIEDKLSVLKNTNANARLVLENLFLKL